MGKRGESTGTASSQVIYIANTTIIYTLYFTDCIIFQIAAEVSAPLAKTDEIVLIGGQDRTTAEVSMRTL